MAAPKNQSRGTNNIVAQVATRINESDNVLVTLSKDPSVDELSAALGLTYILDKMGKHVTAIFSGAIPNVIEFLEPEKTFEVNTDSLRDFIIALDKEKADHLRYKVEGDYVKVFITPYRTNITEADMEFSHGDYNVDLVIALNVANEGELDAALTEYGRIMHDATSINISAAAPGKFGDLEWGDPSASSICEMIFSLVGNLDIEQGAIDKTAATAFLTGIISSTNRFSNERTSPDTFTIASRLMSAGADQRLIALNIPVDILTQELKVNNPEKAEKTEKAEQAKVEEKKAADKNRNGIEVDLRHDKQGADGKKEEKGDASAEADRIAKETIRKAEEEKAAARAAARKAAEEKAAREKAEKEKEAAVRREIEEKVARETKEQEIEPEEKEAIAEPAEETQGQEPELTGEGSVADWKKQKSYVNEINQELEAPSAPVDPAVIKPAEPEDLHELYVPEPTNNVAEEATPEPVVEAPAMPTEAPVEVPAIQEAPIESPNIETPVMSEGQTYEAPVMPEMPIEMPVDAPSESADVAPVIPIAPDPAPEYVAPSLTDSLAREAAPATAETVLPMPENSEILPPPPMPFEPTEAPAAPVIEENVKANYDDPVSLGELAPQPTEPIPVPIAPSPALGNQPSAMEVVSGIQANNPVMSTESAPVLPEPVLPEPVQATAPEAVPAPAPTAEQSQGAVDPGAFQLPPLSN